MKTKWDIKRWMLENCVDRYGNLDLKGLDFSEFNGEVDISGMKVKKNLYQLHQEVGGDLLQGHQKVGKDLLQSNQEVGGSLSQYEQKVGRGLRQNYQEVGGDLLQDNQKVKGYAYIGKNDFTGIIKWDDKEKDWKTTKKIKSYEDMNKEELIKVIKELKGKK